MADVFETTRVCNSCGELKFISEYGPQKNGRGGLNGQCRFCGNAYSRAYVRSHPRNPDVGLAYRSANKERISKAKKDWREAIPQEARAVKEREKNLRKRGISEQEYQAISANQNGLCAICSTESRSRWGNNRLFIDHNHETGAFRGLLCNVCNRALGLFKDDPLLLRQAVEYLETH